MTTIQYAFGEKITFDENSKVIKVEPDDRPLWKKILSDILWFDVK